MAKTNAWTSEANSFHITDETENDLLKNNIINSYLDSDSKFFLVGAKGLGKTLLLRCKSHRYRKRNPDSHFNGSTSELTENLELPTTTFSMKDLEKFHDVNLWEIIWQLAIWTVIFKMRKFPLNNELSKIIGDNNTFTTILVCLLNNRSKINAFKEFNLEFINRRSEIQNGVALFIDDIDQSIENILLDSKLSRSNEIYTKVWINAQIGIMKAIFSIYRKNHHVKIFATIRSEAWMYFDDNGRENIEEHVVELEYTKSEIKEIFENNIKMMDPADYVKSNERDYITRFTGLSYIAHGIIKNPQNNNKQVEESVFNYFYRHTFGRPREIVLIGKAIHSLVTKKEYKDLLNAEIEQAVQNIKGKVREKSNELYKNYSREMIPSFDENEFKYFANNVNGNLIKYENINEELLKIVEKYCKCGFVGYTITRDIKGNLYQKFEPPAKYNYINNYDLPKKVDYFFIHPCLDTTMLQIIPFDQYYNRFNIIGSEYPFIEPYFTHNYQLNDYIPVFKAARGYSKREGLHELGLEVYYRYHFMKGSNCLKYEKLINEGVSTLSFLSRLCYINILKKKFPNNKEFYTEKENTFSDSLKSSFVPKQWQTGLKEEHDSHFEYKLFGRFITLGSYLVLDINIVSIHHLLTEGIFSLEKDDKYKIEKQSAFDYLDRCFFIKELNKEEPKYHFENKSHSDIKNSIYRASSKFEQDTISRFRTGALEEIKSGDWFADEKHKEWLINNVLTKIWKPN